MKLNQTMASDKFLLTFKEVFCRIFDFFKKPLIQKIIFAGYISIFLSLLFVRDVLNTEINKFIFVVLYFIACLFTTNKNFTYLFAFTIPFRIGLPDLYILLISIFFIAIRFYKENSIKEWIIIISVPLVFGLAEFILSIFYATPAFQEAGRIFSVLFLLGFCFYNKRILNYKHILFIFTGFAVAYFLIALASVEITIWGIKHSEKYWMTFENVYKAWRFGNKPDVVNWVNTACVEQYEIKSSIFLSDNPNNVGLSSLICGATAYCAYPIIGDKKEKTACVILGIILTLFGFWSCSRSFLIFEALLGLVLVVVSILHKRREPIDVFITAFFVITVVCIIFLINMDLLNKIINRFYSYDTADAGGRITLIGKYFSHMFTNVKYVLFGVGCLNIKAVYGFTQPPHTNFVQLACGYGIPLTLLFITFIIVAFIKSRKRVNALSYRFAFYIPIVFGFLFTLTDQIFVPTGIIAMFIAPMILASYLYKKNEFAIEENLVINNSIAKDEPTSVILRKLKKLYDHPLKTMNNLKTRIITNYTIKKKLDDKEAVSILYRWSFYKKLNWENPLTFNEKLNWLKINYRLNEFVNLVDKYEVKKIVSEKAGEDISAKTLGVFETVDEIDINSFVLPVVVKTTHNSGCVKVIRKAEDFSDEYKAKLSEKLKENYYIKSREWPYKDVKPRIIIEECLIDETNEILPVYKFFCFNGEPFILQAIKNDKSRYETIDYFDMEWNKLNLKQNFNNSKKPLQKPDNFENMKHLVSKLSKGYPFIRVDLYNVNGKIYFSEFTFFSDAGFAKFKPKKWDSILGEKLILPEPRRDDL